MGKHLQKDSQNQTVKKKSDVERIEFLDLWAVGVYDLGLNNEQWRRLTLLQYDALVKRLSNKIELNNNRIAKLSAVIYNANGAQKKGVKNYCWQPKDFLVKEEGKRQPWQEQLKLAEMLNKAFGGIDNRKNG